MEEVKKKNVSGAYVDKLPGYLKLKNPNPVAGNFFIKKGPWIPCPIVGG